MGKCWPLRSKATIEAKRCRTIAKVRGKSLHGLERSIVRGAFITNDDAATASQIPLTLPLHQHMNTAVKGCDFALLARDNL